MSATSLFELDEEIGSDYTRPDRKGSEDLDRVCGSLDSTKGDDVLRCASKDMYSEGKDSTPKSMHLINSYYEDDSSSSKGLPLSPTDSLLSPVSSFLLSRGPRKVTHINGNSSSLSTGGKAPPFHQKHQFTSEHKGSGSSNLYTESKQVSKAPPSKLSGLSNLVKATSSPSPPPSPSPSSNSFADFSTSSTTTSPLSSPPSSSSSSLSRFSLLHQIEALKVHFSQCPTEQCSTKIPLILATSSSSRQRVVNLLGWEYTVMVPDIDEKDVSIRSEDPMQLPVGIALAKADALVTRISKLRTNPDDVNTLPPPPSSSQSSTQSSSTSSSSSSSFSLEGPIMIITADQIVLFGDKEVREKPIDAQEATRFLQSYSNSSVSTISCVTATLYPTGEQASTVHVANVHWNEITDDMVERIVRRGDIFSSAGGFRVEDEDLNRCIRSLDGGMDSIMGMPIAATCAVMQDVIKRAGL